MSSLSQEYLNNHQALTASTKGAASGNQIMWVAAIMTIFQTIAGWVEKHDS